MKPPVFTEQAMRPPQEAQSLLLRATQGCTYNECAFCYVSRGYPFLAATPEQMEAELVSRKDTVPMDAKVYLTGSNPFALPAKTLKAYLAVVRKHVPAFSEFSMQTRIPDIRAKSLEELKELRGLGLTHLYTGTENGNDDALRKMNKGHTAQETVEQLLRLGEAGIGYVTFYVLGMAGQGHGRASGTATADMFNQVRPRRITTTGLTIFPHTPLHDMARAGGFTEASEKEKVEELLVFLERLTTETFFDSVHYLNPLCYRFNNPQDKGPVVADIKDFLATHSEGEIADMVGRQHMRSL